MTEADSVAGLAMSATKDPQILDVPDTPIQLALTPAENGKMSVHEYDSRDYEKRPHNRRGCVHLQTVEDFLGYTDLHGKPVEAKSTWNPHIFMCREDLAISTIFDHPKSELGSHENASCIHRLTPSDELSAWRHRINSGALSQADLVDWIEDHEHEFMEPNAAKWLSAAEDFRVTSDAAFSSKYDPASGSVNFHYKKENEEQGDIKVPTNFTIGIPIFKGGAVFKLPMRFRYRCAGGQVNFSFRFTNIEKAINQVWEETLEHVGTYDFKGCQPEIFQVSQL